MPSCHKCGSPVRHAHAVHECQNDLRFVATRAYDDDARRQRAIDNKLGQWVDLAIERIADGTDPREAIETAVDCAFVHGKCAQVRDEIRAVILGERGK